ncbi:hypothetical protein EVA_03204, partial [gut metagenome]
MTKTNEQPCARRKDERYDTLEDFFAAYDNPLGNSIVQYSRSVKREDQMRRLLNLVALGMSWTDATKKVKLSDPSVKLWRRRYGWMRRAAEAMDALIERNDVDGMLALAAAYADEARVRMARITARRAALQAETVKERMLQTRREDGRSTRLWPELARVALEREMHIRAETARGAETFRKQLEKERARYPHLRPGRTNCLNCQLLGTKQCTGELFAFSVWRECTQWVEADSG